MHGTQAERRSATFRRENESLRNELDLRDVKLGEAEVLIRKLSTKLIGAEDQLLEREEEIDTLRGQNEMLRSDLTTKQLALQRHELERDTSAFRKSRGLPDNTEQLPEPEPEPLPTKDDPLCTCTVQ